MWDDGPSRLLLSTNDLVEDRIVDSGNDASEGDLALWVVAFCKCSTAVCHGSSVRTVVS